jgi:hypothetical protein
LEFMELEDTSSTLLNPSNLSHRQTISASQSMRSQRSSSSAQNRHNSLRQRQQRYVEDFAISNPQHDRGDSHSIPASTQSNRLSQIGGLLLQTDAESLPSTAAEGKSHISIRIGTYRDYTAAKAPSHTPIKAVKNFEKIHPRLIKTAQRNLSKVHRSNSRSGLHIVDNVVSGQYVTAEKES